MSQRMLNKMLITSFHTKTIDMFIRLFVQLEPITSTGIEFSSNQIMFQRRLGHSLTLESFYVFVRITSIRKVF